MAEWVIDCGIKTVVMESTGVYWILACQILEPGATLFTSEFEVRDGL